MNCEHDLYVSDGGAIMNGSQCGRVVTCVLCRSCNQHCHGHMQLKDGLKWRQFDFVESHGRSEK